MANVKPEWKNGAEGFIQFIEDVKPLMRSSYGEGYDQLILTDFQKDEIRKSLSGDYRMICWCWPRRHSKTLLNAAIIYWKFMCFKTQHVGIVANSVNQSIDTSFEYVSTFISMTPFSRSLVKNGQIRVNRDEIVFPEGGSRIKGYPHKAGVLYGKKLTIIQVSELHAFRDPTVFTTVTGNTPDSVNALVLVDSTASDKGNLLWKLYQNYVTGADETLYFSYLYYENEAELLEKAPPWITREGLKTQKLLLELEFEKEFLNKWSSGTHNFFRDEVLDECTSENYGELDEIADGRDYLVGAGLDRATADWKRSDRTVLTYVVRVIIDETDHYYVLDAQEIPKAFTLNHVKRSLRKAHEDWTLKNVILESYDGADMHEALQNKQYTVEKMSPTAKTQYEIFMQLQRLANSGRLHVHPKFKALIKEMRSFQYWSDDKNHYTFQHPKGEHDDYVYSLAWAIRAITEYNLHPYVLGGIHCNETHPRRKLCLLNGGQSVPLCARECKSMKNVFALHNRYSTTANEKLDVKEFYQLKVVNTGPRMSRR